MLIDSQHLCAPGAEVLTGSTSTVSEVAGNMGRVGAAIQAAPEGYSRVGGVNVVTGSSVLPVVNARVGTAGLSCSHTTAGWLAGLPGQPPGGKQPPTPLASLQGRQRLGGGGERKGCWEMCILRGG